MNLKKFIDPLRVYSGASVCGDVLLITSGGSFGNPVRVTSAVLGLSTHAIGIFKGMDKPLRLFGRTLSSNDLVMGVGFVCGILYFISGMNFFGFESSLRHAEALLGILISAASFCVMTGRRNMAMVLFSISPFCHIVQGIEVYFTQGRFDLFQFGAGVCFLVSGIASRYVRKTAASSTSP